MAIARGDRLGPYEILGPLGSGGMGVIYRARDPRLNREVAIKVLPAEIGRDEGALQRFELEARAVAALSHPNILAIHDFGRSDDRSYAVMELLRGESLRDRLVSGPLPRRRAVDYAVQIAHGLAAAHDKGIVHRDLKPENVFLTADGHVKILDFGLAAPSSGNPGGPHDTQPVTQEVETDPDIVLGTAAYMSPEQIRGKRPDPRSDIFALGSILYEMLTGEHAFLRDTGAETMTAILREEPPLLATEDARLSPALLAILRHCLEKRPRERFQSARDLAFDLQHLSEITTASHARAATDADSGGRSRWFTIAALMAVALVAGAGLDSLLFGPDHGDPVRHTQLTFSGHDRSPSASPDGRTIAFTSDRDGLPRIWLKQLPGEDEIAITDGPDDRPRISPDGASLLYVHSDGTRRGIYRVALIGGAPRKLVDDAYDADWSPEGKRIVFLRRFARSSGPVSVVSVAAADGSDEHEIYRAPDVQLDVPRWSPDGRWIAMIETRAAIRGEQTLRLLDLDTKETHGISRPGGHSLYSSVAWTDGGQSFVYARTTSPLGGLSRTSSEVLLRRLQSDESRLLFWAQNLFTSVAVSPQIHPAIDVIGDGRLVYDVATSRQNLRSYTLTGDAQAVTLLTLGNSRDRQPTFSRDGETILFSSNRSGNLDLWTLQVPTGEVTRLTEDTADDWDPAFAPDDRAILWSSDRTGSLEIWMCQRDGTRPRQISRDGFDAENPTMTPDGRWIVYASGNPRKLGIWKIHPDGSGATRIVAGPRFLPEVSPDGRYVVFMKNDAARLRNVLEVFEVESGRKVDFEIDIPFPFDDPNNLSVGRPRWMPGGRAIAFTADNQQGERGVFLQDFAPGTNTAATRRPVAGFLPGIPTESFGIRPDGRAIVTADQEEVDSIMLARGVPQVTRPRRPR